MSRFCLAKAICNISYQIFWVYLPQILANNGFEHYIVHACLYGYFDIDSTLDVIHSWKSDQERTSDGGNGNHSVSLPIILIKIKVDQMLPSSYISSLLVSILWFCIWFPISINVQLYFGAKMVTFCIIHIGNRKIFLKHHSPPESQLTLLHVSVFSYFT